MVDVCTKHKKMTHKWVSSITTYAQLKRMISWVIQVWNACDSVSKTSIQLNPRTEILPTPHSYHGIWKIDSTRVPCFISMPLVDDISSGTRTILHCYITRADPQDRNPWYILWGMKAEKHPNRVNVQMFNFSRKQRTTNIRSPSKERASIIKSIYPSKPPFWRQCHQSFPGQLLSKYVGKFASTSTGFEPKWSVGYADNKNCRSK